MLRSTGGGLLCLALTAGLLLAGKSAITGRESAVTPNLVLETPQADEMPDPGLTTADGPGGDEAVPVFPETGDDAGAAAAGTDAVTSSPLPPPSVPAGPQVSVKQGNDGEQVETVLRHPVALAAGLVQFEGRTIQLEGLQPQSADRQCAGSSGRWPCGMLARTAFRNFLRARPLVCRTPKDGWTGTLTTRCLVGQDDPALWLAENGWAETLPGAPLESAVDTAKALGKGFYRPVTAPDPRRPPPALPRSDDAQPFLPDDAPVQEPTQDLAPR